MAFTNTMTKKTQYSNGLIVEEGTWDGASVTTGTITFDTTEQPELVKLISFSFSSNGDTAVVPAEDANSNQIKITFQSSDAGKYKLVGIGA